MSVEEMKALVWRFVDEPWNKGNLDVLDEICSPDYGIHYETNITSGSRESLKKGITEVRAGTKDFKATVDEIIVEGDRVAYAWKMTRTDDQGKFKVNVGMTFLKVRDGKIVQDRFIMDEIKSDPASS